jgi:CRISPR-associated endonuclease/helicase Cas3
MPRTGWDIKTWLQKAFDEERLLGNEDVWKKVIRPRIEDLTRLGKWQQWNEFQDRCELLPDRSLLTAPCGSGKTLAAWRWIASRLIGRKVARVIFLYPTRATATEGFRDYVSWAPESDAALMHGTAEYDLQGMFENPDDPRHDSRFEVEQRLFALGFWTRSMFSATVDQFLAFLQYSYGAVCMLPVLADSVVVIDEVHSFDHGMFSALKQFLTNFDVPVLCMTATLLEQHRNQLTAECGLREPEGERPEDLRRVAEAPRYRVERLDDENAVTQRVREALGQGKRVLWVMNQVKRAQDKARELASAFPRKARLFVAPCVPLFCYHSRFCLTDRRDRHQEVVRAFQGETKAVLALCTQVCEMSLDLDADLLVTERAPITSLIQRMGRCNRKSKLPLASLGEVLVYRPPDDRPYSRDVLLGLDKFLERLTSWGTVSQAQLEEALRHAPEPPQVGDKACRFIESGPYALTREETFRDIEEFCIPAVLEGQVETFLALQDQGKPTAGLILPMPRKLRGRPDARLPSYLAVAPDSHYHPAIGFCDRPVI